MKKVTLLLAAILGSAGLNAQIFSDGFEAADGYAVNDYLGTGPNATYWTTWSGGVGGAEDAQVTDVQAATGSNSIRFSSTGANGGPQDVVLDFGQQFTDGIFTYESSIYVVAGANAYFNLQATPTIGQTWALNVNLDGGTLTVDDGITANLATGSYTEATWTTVRIEANLTLNIWEAFIDGTSIGSWSNGVNTVASVDLFPIQGSDFYVDDVSFDHGPFTLPNLNAVAAGLNIGGNIAGLDVTPTVTVVNGGQTEINSFDVVIDYNGNQYTENVTGQTLASTNSLNVVFTSTIPLVAGATTATATISNINGGIDDNAGDDVVTVNVDPVVPAAGKVVVGEEGTGTWCPWCVRGTVFMDRFANDYGPFWAGIAVHNGDPMVVDEYDTGLGGLISGYPSAVVDRGSDVDPSAMTNDFFERLQIAPAATIVNGATWDDATRTLSVSVTATFQSAASDSYKMLCVLTEDGVTGTESGYAQANAYAGGSNGVMGGYENLPSPVPAAQMVYDHVARAIAPSFGGANTCFPTSISAGETVTNNYVFVLPDDWNEDEIYIIGMLVSPDGRIDNAGKATITDAVSNGWVEGCTASVGELIEGQLDDVLRVYPNPASTVATVEINIDQEADVQLTLVDMSGKVIASEDYGTLSTASVVNLNTSDLKDGMYIVELTVNGTKITKRLAIK